MSISDCKYLCEALAKTNKGGEGEFTETDTKKSGEKRCAVLRETRFFEFFENFRNFRVPSPPGKWFLASTNKL